MTPQAVDVAQRTGLDIARQRLHQTAVEILRASKNTSSAIMNTAQSASGMNQYMVRYYFHHPVLHYLLHNIFHYLVHHILLNLLHRLFHHLVLHHLLHYLDNLLHYLLHYLLHHLNYLFCLRRNVALLYFTTL
jgi:hypothetical protein